MSAPRLPPFQSLLKSRDVEDPINLWFNRPMAYAFVALVYRTPLTPNQVTVLSIVVGMVAAGCFWQGGESGMLWGGILLWASAILDGADGILARAKQQFSAVGRALDGSADLIVALVVGIGAGHHLWVKHQSLLQLALIIPIAATTTLQAHIYDYYKESFLLRTRSDWDGVPERIGDVHGRIAALEASHAPWLHRKAMGLYLDLIVAQTRFVALADPAGSREHLTFRVSPQSTADYRKYNLGPLRIWTAISLAPHSYLFAIFGMLDRIDLYLWLRLVGANLLFALALFWQRRASAHTRAALDRAGLAPVPVASPA
ncbi:MAG TPA: CDP-alcohol phosphatidyltransferase family protein [Polyangiaceae bacterium]|nr:CDP-alcohol phosphatidyltransferase family protein [Polyangiaceae bacterium]